MCGNHYAKWRKFVKKYPDIFNDATPLLPEEPLLLDKGAVKTCRIATCDNTSETHTVTQGYCSLHYQQLRRKGLISTASGNMSSGEWLVKAMLDSANIRYEAQVQLKAFGHTRVLDFYLPDFNTIIEYDGTFWHADRDKFDYSNLDHKQLRKV